jgi:RHS repeat-associated protein
VPGPFPLLERAGSRTYPEPSVSILIFISLSIPKWLHFHRMPYSNPKFTGKERDSETGLDYFGARYYGSNMGRWTSPDWSGSPSPVPYAKLDNPQSLNLYGYVLNNPATYRDQDGHICIFGMGNTCGGKTPPPPPTPDPAKVRPTAPPKRPAQPSPARGFNITVATTSDANAGAGPGAVMHSEVGKVLFLTTKGVSKSNYTNGAMATPNGANNMPQDATPTVLGAQIQASVQIGIGNATNKQEFSGDSLQLSAGLGAITDGGISFNINSSGIWSLQVNLGVGYGASGSGVVTNTTVQDQILE